MWLGISVEDGARLVWTFDGTEVAPEYVSTAKGVCVCEIKHSVIGQSCEEVIKTICAIT